MRFRSITHCGTQVSSPSDIHIVSELSGDTKFKLSRLVNLTSSGG